MVRMRRALLATLLCAAALPVTPALASHGLVEREAVRAALRLEPHAAGARHVVPLPLPGPAHGGTPARAAALPAGLARSAGPARLLVGVRSHADLAGVAAALERLGTTERRVLQLRYGLAGEAPHTPAETARALGVKPHQVRQVEDRALRTLGALPDTRGLLEAA
jgi:Sigma-70, region 4